MATKLIRTCDRLGCAIDAAPFSPGEELPSYTTVGYTVLKTVTDENGKTTTETLADFNEVCGSCSEAIEDLVARIRGEKRPGRPRKAEETETESKETAIEAAPEKERKKPGPKPGTKRGRPRKVDVEAVAEEKEDPEDEGLDEDEPEILDVNDVLRASVTSGVRKGVESLKAKEAAAKVKPKEVKAAAAAEEEEADPEADLDTFETDSGEIVNADTGEVIASPVDGEEVEEEEPSGPINGVEAHPF